ncbi:MAG: FAD:protein FMN transferase [Ferruginibacter sp.]|nr:FAD:protein FMN transferase [Ferruginibacter sp.]
MFTRLFASLFFLLIAMQLPAQAKRFSFTKEKMGSPFTIILYAPDINQAVMVTDKCFELVDSLVFIFSDYIDSSELNRLCARAGKPSLPMTLSVPLFDILLVSKNAFEKSRGTFDVTLGPVTRLWRRARKENKFPSPEIVKEKLALTGCNKLQLNTIAHTAYLTQQGMQLDLGGIAQGYIAQQVINLLKNNNIANALVDVSGDIAAIGAPPGKSGWTVGVNVPDDKDEILKKPISVFNKSVTTSGDLYQFIYHNGKKYSHIVHPKTGYGITSQRNVTVIANDGTTADWLTKACSLLPVSEGKKLALKLNAALLIVEMKKGKPVLYATKNWGSFVL